MEEETPAKALLENEVSWKADLANAILEECARDAKTSQELDNAVRARTGLEVSEKVVSDCAEDLAAAGKLDKMGNLFVCRKQEVIESSEYAGELEEREVVAELLEEKEMLDEKRTTKSESYDEVIGLVGEMQKSGPVPVEAILCEAEKKGISRENAAQTIREHVEVTGYLYEPKEGCVKIAISN